MRARPGLATDFRNEKYSPPEQSFRWTRRLHFIAPDRNPTLLFLPLRFALFLLAEVDRFGVPERARTVKPRAMAKFVPHSIALIDLPYNDATGRGVGREIRSPTPSSPSRFSPHV